jgi:hypothetical protein
MYGPASGRERFEIASESQDIGSGKISTRSMEVDFAVVLSRVISSIEDDPAQLRDVVYELARIKLRQEAWKRNRPINLLEARRLSLALESAIDRVETIHSKYDELRTLQSLDRLIQSSESGASEVTIEPRTPALIINQPPAHSTEVDHLPALNRKNATWLNIKWLLYRPRTATMVRGPMVAIFGVALCVVLDRQFDLLRRQPPPLPSPVVQKNASSEHTPVVQTSGQGLQSPATMLQSQSSPSPLPRVYGVYAVSGGQLHELEPLAGKVLDPRVFMSTPIKTSSRTVLPDGQIVFIVYRRDVANSVTERVTVRVIAKIMRAMTFNTAGQASTASVEDSWTIRNVSYEFRVAPLNENSEMLMIRPEKVDFVFPAGRYGLVIKGQAYDFTVAGQITESAQCLEGVEASNGMFYSECRSP